MIFVDTSALYAVLDRDDAAHERAREAWAGWLSTADDTALVTSDEVLIETFALVQANLGMEAVRAFHDSVLPVLKVQHSSAEDHEAAMQGMLVANRRRLSLVDCMSFQLMRRLGATRVFAFDRHFAEQGFEVLPL